MHICRKISVSFDTFRAKTNQNGYYTWRRDNVSNQNKNKYTVFFMNRFVYSLIFFYRQQQERDISQESKK